LRIILIYNLINTHVLFVGQFNINSHRHIAGAFRQGAAEDERTVTIAGLDPLTTYLVLKAPDGKKVARMTGKKLAEEGFEVEFNKKYDGELFEVTRD